MVLSIKQGRVPADKQTVCAKCGMQDFRLHHDGEKVVCADCSHPLPKRLSVRYRNNHNLLKEVVSLTKTSSTLEKKLYEIESEWHTESMRIFSQPPQGGTALLIIQATEHLKQVVRVKMDAIYEELISTLEQASLAPSGDELIKAGLGRVLKRAAKLLHILIDTKCEKLAVLSNGLDEVSKITRQLDASDDIEISF